jgi:hypothetical protein
MFRVLVLGGIALVGGSACGGSTAVEADASARDAGFPSETNASSEAGSYVDDGFPTEGVLSVDAEGFPSELPNFPYRDAGREAVPDAGDGSDALVDGGSDANALSDSAPEAGPEAADSATCGPTEMNIGGRCFPIEGPQ